MLDSNIIPIIIIRVIVSLQHRLPADPAARVQWRGVEGQGQVSHGPQAALRQTGQSSKQNNTLLQMSLYPLPHLI